MGEYPRTLVGGVGYHHLSDFSVGPILSERLARESWPEWVTVEDLSYGSIAVYHRLGDETPPFERLVVLGGVRRSRQPGAWEAYRWDGRLPDTEAIQERVAEAATACIGLETLVLVVAGLGRAPRELYVIEIEPWVEAMGEELTPPVEKAAQEAARMARTIALSPRGVDPVPTAPLGGLAAAGRNPGRVVS